MVWIAVSALAAALLAGLAACSPARLLNATVATDRLMIATGLAYGDHPRQRLDVYTPKAAAGSLPVVVYFYGGAWQNGDRDTYVFLAEALASRGFVVVIPDYRVYPTGRFPVFLEDAAQAVRWTVDQIGTHGGDPERLFLMGHSAGAHIGAMLALDTRYLTAAGVPADRVAGFVGLAGPYDFLPITGPDIRRVFATAARPEDTQPITFVRADAPPMLLLTGTDDDTVLPRNSESLGRALRAAGGTAEVKAYPGIGHIGIVSALAGLFRGRAPVLEDTVGFMSRVATTGPRQSAAIPRTGPGR